MAKMPCKDVNSIFDSKINGIKTLWKNLNGLISAGKRRDNLVKINKLNYNGKSITDGTEISNVMNEYFCSVGNNLVSKLPIPSNFFTDYLPKPICNSIFVEPVTVTELEALIKMLKVNKACGEDGISARLIKDLGNLLIAPLTYVFN